MNEHDESSVTLNHSGFERDLIEKLERGEPISSKPHNLSLQKARPVIFLPMESSSGTKKKAQTSRMT